MDEGGIGCTESVGADTPAVGRARREGLDDDVGPGGEVSDLLLPLRRAEIGDNALLAPVPHQEARLQVGAEPVTLRRFDLEHACTRIGQHHAAHRGGDARRPEFQHIEPFADPRHCIPLGFKIR